MKAIHHVCIQTNQYEASLDFYTRVLEFHMVKETRDFHNRAYNTWLELEDFMIELQTGKEGETLTETSKPSQGIVHMCFLVDNVANEVERILSLGYDHFSLKNGCRLYEVEGSALSKIIAPEGSIIELRDTKLT